MTPAEVGPGCLAQYVNCIEVRTLEFKGGLFVAVLYICRRMLLVLGLNLLASTNSGRIARTPGNIFYYIQLFCGNSI